MSETLVIRPAPPKRRRRRGSSWTRNGARAGPVQSGPVADALRLAVGPPRGAAAARQEITLAEPELPMRGGARLAQAVPFALEEQLASDVEPLHFAVGASATGPQAPRSPSSRAASSIAGSRRSTRRASSPSRPMPTIGRAGFGRGAPCCSTTAAVRASCGRACRTRWTPIRSRPRSIWLRGAGADGELAGCEHVIFFAAPWNTNGTATHRRPAVTHRDPAGQAAARRRRCRCSRRKP